MLTAPDTTNLTDEIEDRSWWAEASCATGGAGLSALFFSDELQDNAAGPATQGGSPRGSLP